MLLKTLNLIGGENILKTFGFTDTNDFAEYLADTVDKLRVEENIGVGLCVVAKYHAMKDILNSIIKNTNFELESCEEFDDPILTEYDGEYVLCLDMNDLLVNILKSDCVMFDEDDIVFVHGDVNSAFVKDNEDSGCTMHEFNIDKDAEDASDECDGNCKNCICTDISEASHENITFDKDDDGNIHGFTSVKSNVNGYEKREFYSSKPIDLSDFDEYDSVGRLFDLLDFIF